MLEALLEYELAVGSSPEVTEARLRGQEYLLERRLFRRRSTGEVIERDRKGGAAWTRFAFPTWWHYDVLRGLEYLRRAGVAPDERVAEAIDLVASKRDGDGRWPLETQYPGTMPVEMDEGEGQPSRWNTLRALRVLRWYDRAGSEDARGRAAQRQLAFPASASARNVMLAAGSATGPLGVGTPRRAGTTSSLPTEAVLPFTCTPWDRRPSVEVRV